MTWAMYSTLSWVYAVHVARRTGHANASFLDNYVQAPLAERLGMWALCVLFQAAGKAPRRPQAYVTYPHISVILRMALRPDGNK